MSIPSSPRGGDELTNVGLIILVAAVAIPEFLRVAGTAAAYITGIDPPTSGFAAGIGVLLSPQDPGSALDAPGLDPVLYWAVVGVLLTCLGATAWGVWRLSRRGMTRVSRDPHRLVGTATGRDVAKVASSRALLARSRALRPSLGKPAPSDVGYLLGSSKGRDVWASVEDSVLVLGPPRSGKGLHLVINAILDAPGAVITTSTRPDNLTATMKARQRRGPVAVFDPQHLA